MRVVSHANYLLQNQKSLADSELNEEEKVMPLDVQTKAVLDGLAAANFPKIETLPAPQARAVLAMLRPTAEPEPIHKVEDRKISVKDGEIGVRIYTPSAGGSLPGLVYFHGGGWVVGDLESHDGPCRTLANRAGMVVISVDYRLAPEYKYPTAAEDCYAATVWTSENAAELNIDPNFIAVGGDSAGGNLATVVSMMARDKGAPKIAFQLLVYPVTTHYQTNTVSYNENAEGYFLTRDLMNWFWDSYLNDVSEAQHAYAAPLQCADLSGLPPAFVTTAEFDPLRDEGEAYVARLREAGVPVTHKRYDSTIHGAFTMGAAIDKGREMLEDSAAALRAAYKE
jgi:acetyl esterase